MKITKKALAGVLLSVGLAGGIVAPAVASKFDATTPVAYAQEQQATTVIVVHYIESESILISKETYTLSPGESMTFAKLGGYEFVDWSYWGERSSAIIQSGTSDYVTIEYSQAVALSGISVFFNYAPNQVTETTTSEPTTTEAPSTTTSEPTTTEAPTTEAPTTEVPTTEAPTTEAPTTEAPTTEAPTTEAPTTEVPTTEVPTTEVPTTEVPTTEVPTTEVPTTEVPTTEAPTTATVSFDLAGGSLNGQTGTVNLEAKVGETITLPEAPVKEGHTFLYWKGSVYQAGAQYTVTGPKTFTAVWEPVAAPTTTTTSASETPKKILPATGEASSLLSLSGLGLAGFAGFLGFKRKQD